MARLGFVGLGVMGGGIAGRLLAAGHEVHGYNRTRQKAQALVERGLAIEETRLSIMVGGDEDAFNRVEPILRDIGPTVKRVGENGQAVLLKIAINLSLHVQMTAFSEGLLLAEKGGIDKEVAVEAMLNSVIASPMVKYRGPMILEQPEEAWFDVNMMQKD